MRGGPISDGNEALIDSWQLSLHNKAGGTRDEYRKQLRYYCDWLDKTERADGDLLQVKRGDVEAWLLELRDAGYSGSTINNRWIALRSFYWWCEEEEEVDRSPVAKVTVTRGEEDPPDIPKPDDFEAMLKACAGKGFLERRDTAILRFLASTGARRAEAAGVDLEEIDLQTRVALLHGKGSKIRVVRFDPKTAAAIDRYMRVRAKHRHAASPKLWIGGLGALTPAGVAQVVERRGLQAGLTGSHTHMLRHFWADRAKRSGMSDEVVMTLGGWKDQKVMRRYGQALAAERALAAYDQFDPLAGI